MLAMYPSMNNNTKTGKARIMVIMKIKHIVT